MKNCLFCIGWCGCDVGWKCGESGGCGVIGELGWVLENGVVEVCWGCGC